MKIKKLGVKVTDTPWSISIHLEDSTDVDRYVIRFAEQAWTREEVEEVCDALTIALAEYDALTATTYSHDARVNYCPWSKNDIHDASCYGSIGELLCGGRP